MAMLTNIVVMIRPGEKMGKPITRAFNALLKSLKNLGIQTMVFDQSTATSVDALFPSCWLITLPEGIVAVLPMFRRDRRQEKRDDILETLQKQFLVKDIEDWSEYEVEGFFLEGTASMVMDHENKLIYSCLSKRTHTAVLEKFATAHRYKAITFTATDSARETLLHTNMVMHFGEDFVLLCEEAFTDDMELMAVKQLLLTTNHKIIPFSLDQLSLFAGNSMSCKDGNGKAVLLMSSAAEASLSKEQRKQIGKGTTIIPIPVDSIEVAGSGSLSAMMAPVWLQSKLV